MAYVTRDSNGKMVAYYGVAQYANQEEVAEDAAEVIAYLNPPTPASVQIAQLEATTLMNRFVREAMIAISVQTATGLGLTEPQLYAANIGYKRLKDLDAQIAVLRGQI